MRAHAAVILLLCAVAAHAHVGSPDVYVTANAGPYALLVSVHPPAATPGAAEVDVRSEDGRVTAVAVSAAVSAQTPEELQRFAAEGSFTGSVWVPAAGAWRVLIHVRGSSGEGETSVPVPASVVGTRGPSSMAVLLGWLLFGAMAGAAVLAVRRRRGWMSGMAVGTSVLVVVAVVWARGRGTAAAAPAMQAELAPGGKLALTLPGRTDDLVPDHAHLLHLFAIREPEMDVILHLHPEQVAAGHFVSELPSMAPGAFALFADVVHQDGTPETYVARAGLPFETGRALVGDDAVGVVPGLARSDAQATSVPLADGYRMTFERPAAIHARSGELLRFALLDRDGKPPADMELYMGMAAHAAIVKTDGSVFAHIHPAGNIPMAAYGMNMAGMSMSAAPESAVSFPFGFPSAGRYRIFVEMKHGGRVETGAFDVSVE